MLGLYVHIPFCAAICNYCNFNRGLFDGDLKGRYVEALIHEIQAGLKTCPTTATTTTTMTGVGQDFSPANPAVADTIFFGGGTPSLLEPAEVARIIQTCRDSFDVADDCEVTLEANPETVDVDRLRAFRAAGINRVSFGVQSFRDEELVRLSRLHGAARARDAFQEARAAGFDNISLDLMMWLPGQQVGDWLESIDQAIGIAPDHLSLYLLELYPNAPLKEEMARSHWSQAPDEAAAAMYLDALDRLDAAGYQQYEISNVARPGFQSRHNLKYWTDGEWLGFGCGAHSTRGDARWKNVSATDDYIARINSGESPAADIHGLSADERMGDAVFTGLRLSEGVDEAAIERRYGVNLWSRYGPELAGFLDAGLLKRQNRRLWLTRQGMLLANEVMAVFV